MQRHDWWGIHQFVNIFLWKELSGLDWSLESFASKSSIGPSYAAHGPYTQCYEVRTLHNTPRILCSTLRTFCNTPRSLRNTPRKLRNTRDIAQHTHYPGYCITHLGNCATHLCHCTTHPGQHNTPGSCTNHIWHLNIWNLNKTTKHVQTISDIWTSEILARPRNLYKP